MEFIRVYKFSIKMLFLATYHMKIRDTAEILERINLNINKCHEDIYRKTEDLITDLELMQSFIQHEGNTYERVEELLQEITAGIGTLQALSVTLFELQTERGREIAKA